jgi:hypothetical protein
MVALPRPAARGAHMSRQQFFMITGTVGALFGLAFVLMPDLSLRNYGVPTDPHNLMQARYFGSALLAVGVITFMAREVQDAAALRAVMAGNLVGDTIGAVVTLMSLGIMNSVAWSSVVLYALFAAGNAYFLTQLKPRAQAAPAA